MDATQWAGVLSFGAASMVCLFAGARPWPLLAIANACFAGECALGWRHGLHDKVAAAMGAFYSGRAAVQVALIVAIIAVGALFLIRPRGGTAPRAKSGAATATILSILLFLLETISLHDVDALLYRPAAGLLLIGWLWLILGGATIIVALQRQRTGVSSK